MSDNSVEIENRPVGDGVQEWLDDLDIRVENIRDMASPQKRDSATTGVVIGRICGDSMNSFVWATTLANTTDEGLIESRDYEKVKTGIDIMWRKAKGAVANHGHYFPEDVKEDFEKNVFEKYEGFVENIKNHNFNNLNDEVKGVGQELADKLTGMLGIYDNHFQDAVEAAGGVRQLYGPLGRKRTNN